MTVQGQGLISDNRLSVLEINPQREDTAELMQLLVVITAQWLTEGCVN